MNTQLVDSLIQVIQALSPEEKIYLEEKLFFELSEPSTQEVKTLAQKSRSYEFLFKEPDLYTLDDGALVQNES